MKVKAKREQEQRALEAEAILCGVALPVVPLLKVPDGALFLFSGDTVPRPRIRERHHTREAYCLTHGTAKMVLCTDRYCEHRAPVIYCAACSFIVANSYGCPLHRRRRP